MEELGPLVERAQAGDLEAYAEIVRRFQDMAYGYAYSILGDFHLAQDAAQEAFVQAYRDLKTLREPAAFPCWFRRIAFKHCDRIERNRPSTQSLDAVSGEPASDQTGPAEAAEKRELRDRVLAAVRALPEPQRTVTTLFYINGYTVNDIAEFLETPAGTVKRRLHDSRKQLNERMMAMVADTVKSRARKPDEAGDAVMFLLGFGERIGAGEPLLSALQGLCRNAKTKKVRGLVGQMVDSITEGHGLSQVFDRNQGVLPPLVVSLVKDGERFGILDETCRLAACWLRNGSFEASPYLFARGFQCQLLRQIERGAEQGAKAIVIDSTRVAPVVEGSKHSAVWIELLMPDGSLVKGEPWDTPLGSLSEFGRLREHTLLDPHQEGDTITGKLRLRLSPQDASEVLTPIAFRPLPNGEEVRIDPNCSGAIMRPKAKATQL